ncbi:MAG: RnfABCDGE type electron transport complex subunit G [Tannerella sp.]|jgi:electron transport complex protein RnfG|nr:RnfABCDGE type electron transport complex subunit G [Tannerella sp.]
MKKLSSSLPNMLLVLTFIAAGAGGILASVNQLTAEPILANNVQLLKEAVSVVTPEFDNNPVQEAYRNVTSDGDSLIIYPAKKDGKTVGVAVESSTKKGYAGEIRIIVGFDADGKIIDYSVIQHSETPGLGSKMQDWFRSEKNKRSVLGRSLAAGNLTVSKDGGDVDAITAATVSSRAFLDAINRAYSAYRGTDADSGASKAADNDASPSDENVKTQEN